MAKPKPPNEYLEGIGSGLAFEFRLGFVGVSLAIRSSKNGV